MRAFFQLRFSTILMVLCLIPISELQASQLEPKHVAVVYNEKSEHSRECAQLYAKVRSIPENNLLALSIPVSKRDITQQEYDEEVAAPLLKLAASRQIQFPAARKFARHPIYAMVLMPDLPLRIKATPPPSGEKARPWQNTTAASVDSELALLGMKGYSRDRMINNPYFKAHEGIVLSGFRMMPVCRIDSPSPSINRRLITSPVEVEKNGGLRGWVIIDQGGPYPIGDAWLQGIAKKAIAAGQPVFMDALRPSLVDDYPLPQPASVYFGWYEGSANGPFRSSGNATKFRFVEGAVAVHLHSFSATNVRSRTEGWVGALLEKGADVAAGNVWEPFLGGSLYLEIFYDRLLEGYTVAEASAMATPQMSWQGIVIGDPLYRPYPQPPKPAVMNIGMEACAEFVDKKYASAMKKFAHIVTESGDPAVQMRAALCVVQCQLLLQQRDEAKRSLERIFELLGDNPYLRAAQIINKQHFPEGK